MKTILGRPWRIYASTVYLDCEMSGAVRPEGWNYWKKTGSHATARYAEFNSTGDGASPADRPDWTRQLKNPTRKKSRLKPSSAARITGILTCVGRLVPSAGNLNGVRRVAKNYCSTLGGVLATIVPADKKMCTAWRTRCWLRVANKTGLSARPTFGHNFSQEKMRARFLEVNYLR